MAVFRRAVREKRREMSAWSRKVRVARGEKVAVRGAWRVARRTLHVVRSSSLREK